MRLSLDSGGYFLLRDPLDSVETGRAQGLQDRLLPVDSLGNILAGQAWEELKDFVADKYVYVYWTREGKRTGALAGYIVQCMLFERVAGGGGEMPIISAFSLEKHCGKLNTGVMLGSDQFEVVHREWIEYVAAKIATLVPENGDAEFEALANNACVCVTVLMPKRQGQFEKTSYFPRDANPDNLWQQITLLGVPPYPILLPKKLTPFLTPQFQSTDLSPFIYRPQKFAPPQVDPAVVKSLESVYSYNSDLALSTEAFLSFAGALVARLHTMVESGELKTDWVSTSVGEDLAQLWEDFKRYEKEAQANNLMSPAEVTQLAALLNIPVCSQFWQRCDVPKCRHYCDVTLPCGHKLCTAHFSTQVEAVPLGTAVRRNSAQTGILCVCGVAVPTAVLQAYDGEMYAKLLSDRDARLTLVTCPGCSASIPAKVLVSLQCNHAVCMHCVAATEKCTVCNLTFPGLVKWLEGVTIPCDSCAQLVKGTEVSAGMCGENHLLCGRCLLFSVKRTECVVKGCRWKLGGWEVGMMREKAKGKCGYCGEWKDSSMLLDTLCDCIICISCAVKKACKTASTDFCWGCERPLQPEVSQLIQKRAAVVPHCFVCNKKSPSTEIELVCGEWAHQRCLLDMATAVLSSENTDDRILCSCGIEVYAEQIQDRWDREHLPARISSFLLSNSSAYSISCPFCDSTETAEIMPSLSIPTPTTCSRCSHTFCVLCLKDWEEKFHGQGMCNTLINRQKIREIEGKRKVAVQCPYCRLPQERGKDWQECEMCKKHFCAMCVARFDVIQVHGKSYHRPDCDLRTSEFDGAFGVHCTMCQIQGGDEACSPPRRLARRGQFNPSELLFH